MEKNCCCTDTPLDTSIQSTMCENILRTFSDFGMRSILAALIPCTFSFSRNSYLERFQQVMSRTAEAKHQKALEFCAVLADWVFGNPRKVRLIEPHHAVRKKNNFGHAQPIVLGDVGRHLHFRLRKTTKVNVPFLEIVLPHHYCVLIPNEVRLRILEISGMLVHLGKDFLQRGILSECGSRQQKKSTKPM